MSKIKIISHISDKGWPTHNKKYPYAHEEASKAEKRNNPEEFKKSVQLERKLGKHELMATHTKKGKIEIERKFAKDKKMKKDLIIHEKKEHEVMTRGNKNAISKRKSSKK